VAGFEDVGVVQIDEREVGAVAATAREEAEIKAAIVLARRFPRDENAAYTRIIKACKRPSFAEGAMYSFPRGNQIVTGPSVQLAREIARCWGNIRYGLRVVSIDDQMVHIRGYAYDAETNAYVEAEDKFSKLIYRRGRGWVQPDERELRELINRRGAILIRNCILQVVPSDIVEDAQRVVQETLRKAAQGEIDQNREDAIRRLALAFDGLGVSTEVLERYLGHPLSAITAEEIAHLRGVYKSIVDGHTRTTDHFDLSNGRQQSESNAELNSRLKGEDNGESSTSKRKG
jgi:hypothetical protein